MAKSGAVWGIDIGHCALKALCCRPHEKDDHRIVVEAFDYIEYPKILTQPEADRETLIREALEQFVSRNDLEGHSVAISVPGQSGLARFIKLPPVERKKIPDIVKYEARQQIPFALEDVVWDYQPLIGKEDEGYALETEVGLFAMKRDQVARALKPLEDAGVEVDYIQLAPLAIYNYICFDRMKLEGPYDPANQPPSTVVISLGTDTTDLVITNGYRVWQRNIPIGGNHFTKALTKELKLTFAKAEHLKRNATKSENPKAVFQAMRPVFSDLVAEIQRSIGFFTSNNRHAKLGEVIALGNPIKLPGLQRYLSQNLDQEVRAVEQIQSLVGGTAAASPQFKENQLTFGVAYGLAIQALGHSQIRTNLLPGEIVTTRLVRAKKPWAVAAAALLLVGMTVNYASHYSSWTSANTEDPAMQRALREADSTVSSANNLVNEHQGLVTRFSELTTIGHNLQSNVDGRLLWLELLKAIDVSLPRDPRPIDEREETAEDVSQRPELHITRIDCERFEELSTWFTAIQSHYEAAQSAEPPAADGAEGLPGDEAAADEFADEGQDEFAAESFPGQDGAFDDGSALATGEGAADLSGPGWVIEMEGYHFHNADPRNQGERFIQNSFFKNLESGTVPLPDGPNGELIDVPIAELGIRYPVVVTQPRLESVTYLFESVDMDPGQGQPRSLPILDTPRGGAGALPPGEEMPKTGTLRRYRFVIQFAWQPRPRGERLQQWAEQGRELPATAATVADDPTQAL